MEKKIKKMIDFCFDNLKPNGKLLILKKWIFNQYKIDNANLYFSEKDAILCNLKKFSYLNFIIWFLKSLFFQQ